MADNRGGPRTANVGARLPQRSDMRITPSNLPKSQSYGEGVQQAQALTAVPAAGPPSTPTGGGPATAQPQVALGPGDVPSLSDPTANPGEPLTAGLRAGPGAGPEALGITPQSPEEISVLRFLYTKYPYEDIRQLLDWAENSL